METFWNILIGCYFVAIIIWSVYLIKTFKDEHNYDDSNRQSERDRKKAEANYKVNLKSKHQLDSLAQLHVDQNNLYKEQNKELVNVHKTLKALLKELDNKPKK